MLLGHSALEKPYAILSERLQTLHKKKPSAMSSEQNLITIRRFLFSGLFFDNNRLLQMPRQHCSNFPNIALEKSRVNSELKDKIIRNIKSWWLNNLKSNQKNPRIELLKIRVNLNYTLSNSYNGADLMFLY